MNQFNKLRQWLDCEPICHNISYGTFNKTYEEEGGEGILVD